MKRQPKKFAACLMAACLGGAVAQAGEKVELRGSTSIELPKPDRTLEENRRFKFDTGAGELEGGYVPPQNVGGNHPLDRKLKEMLDRKKNWIFVNPYDRKLDGRSAEILGKSDSSTGPLGEHHLLQEGEKGAMQKFLEEKNTRRASESKTGEAREGRESRDSRDEVESQSNRGESPEEEIGPGRDRKEKTSVLFTSDRGSLDFKSPGFDASEFDKRMERTPLDGSMFGPNRMQRPVVDKDEIKKQQETRDAEFDRFIQPRGLAGGAPGLAGRLDPLNTAADSTRQEANPAAARRTDQFLSPNNRVDFGASRSGGLSSSLPGSSVDFGDNSRVSTPTTFLPTTTPAPAAQTPGFGPSPFVLEFPRRKF